LQGHEASDAKRELRDRGPLVELLITTEASGDDDDPKAEQSSRELDAQQQSNDRSYCER
jgi:hypothetical protein